METQLIQSILVEFEKTQGHSSELLRLQNELCQNESELVALKIRFEYKFGFEFKFQRLENP